jgi:hypothetical protein
VTTWLSFKITMPPPAPSEDGKPDQAQAMTQSMSTIMPLMYGFFALSFSVGLSIYFIVSNIAQIVQYALMGRANFGNLFGQRPRPAAVSAPAPKAIPANSGARAKPSGGGAKPSPARSGAPKPTPKGGKTKMTK